MVDKPQNPSDKDSKAQEKTKIKKHKRALIAFMVIVLIAGISLWIYFHSHQQNDKNIFTGYVTSDNIYMSSPIAGTLLEVYVKRGQRVSEGDALFRIDPTVREAETTQARAQLNAAEADVNQQNAALGHAQAELAAAQSEVERNETELNRLLAAQKEKKGSVAQLEIDQVQTSFDAARSRKEAADTQVTSALSAIDAAKAQAEQMKALITSRERELNDLSPPSPKSGKVEDIMFKPGESVPSNVPIISIIPDGEIKVRFYIPQNMISHYQTGQQLFIGCDGCKKGMTATIDYVASKPEYTPPIIYSLDARQKLVFMVEANPSEPGVLIPGQPIDVGATAEDLSQ